MYDRIILSSKMKIITPLSFWDEIWLKEGSLRIFKEGWDLETRKILEQKFLDELSEYEQNNAFITDIFTEDYLQQLVLNIHPESLHKNNPSILNVRIVKLTQPEIKSFDNGTIILTTGLLTECHSEYDLVLKLATEIAKIEMDQQYILEKNTILSKKELDSKALEIALNFQRQLEVKNKNPYRNNFQFSTNLSNVLSFSAKQYFFAKKYDLSMKCISRLMETGLMSQDDYLIAAKITRLTGNTYESNSKAFEYLEKAATTGNVNLIDIQPEYGLLYIRLGKSDEAAKYFENYKKALESMPDKNENTEEIKWAESMITKCKKI